MKKETISITVKRSTSGATERIEWEAWRFDGVTHFAATRPWTPQGPMSRSWSLTHLPTGREVVYRLPNRQCAEKIARTLESLEGVDWSPTDVQAFVMGNERERVAASFVRAVNRLNLCRVPEPLTRVQEAREEVEREVTRRLSRTE